MLIINTTTTVVDQMSVVNVRGQPQLQLTMTPRHVHWDVRVVETWLLYQLNFSAFWSDMMPDHNVFYCWFCGVYTAVPGYVPVLEFVQMCHLGRGWRNFGNKICWCDGHLLCVWWQYSCYKWTLASGINIIVSMAMTLAAWPVS